MTDPSRTNKELIEENAFLKQRIQELEHPAAGLMGAEELLQLERELYLDMLNHQPAGVYRIRVFPKEMRSNNAWSNSENPPFHLELFNDRVCEILKMDRQVFETTPGIILDLVHIDDKAEYNRRNEEANAKLIPFEWEGRLYVGGEILWIHFESLPRPAGNGEVVWTGIFYDITERKKREEDMKELISELQKAIEEIKTLRGILPICANCKKIRDDKGYWNQIECYIRDHSEAEFSHGICPECARKLYPDCLEDD
jgi:PAS domain-containing protein